jgi:preprotein translocase subunit YajC
MNKLLRFGLVAGLLIAVLAFTGGCLAPAATTSADGTPVETSTWGSIWPMLVFLVVIFGMFYFVMIRPQRKRQKEQQAMMSALKVGDKVMTIGGIFGTIEKTDEHSLVLKMEGGQVIRVARNAVNPVKDDSVAK